MSDLFYLVVYDIPSTKKGNKRRKRLSDLLEGYGTRTQYSVFECFLNAKQFVQLQHGIEITILPAEDSIRIYVLDAGALRRTIVYGSEFPRKEETIIL
ncbi:MULTISPECIES: CRISPR-associated endonuclease Cas2 [Spirulina sp. CCY15215]|uniref:CRISPR-associated endonuclease Cas2 n=1 Tax=Spirulina sp. CCY15215 TaxID=2767591 RepID=UPI00194DFEFB|nr:CRISPR-associated endonuclease Cas2 [Spirulina major]